jgi:hypothetical protein
VQALVDEIVAVRLGQGTAQASSLEPTPSATPVPYSPTRSDFDIAKLARLPSDIDPSVRAFIETGFVFDEYAARYVGMECVNNEEPSRERFRNFVTLSVSNLFGNDAPIPTTREIASQLAEAMQVQIRQGKSPVQRECMRPFAFPVSDQDVDLAWGLIKGADGTTAFNPFSSYLNNALKRNFYQWFDSEESKGKPLIVWWCDPTVHMDTC